MVAKVALIGIPVETARVIEMDNFPSFSVYVPGLTNIVRSQVVSRVAAHGIQIVDLGEPDLGETKIDFSFDRREGVGYNHLEKLKKLDLIEKLQCARTRILKEEKSYDLLVAIGMNHLGGIVLYDKRDMVARLDYHSDFSAISPEGKNYDYASYMDWVNHNLGDVMVTNYFVNYAPSGIFGQTGTVCDGSHASANHFDIDVDCFNMGERIQNIYPHTDGDSIATPTMVVRMINDARPAKLGIWEYRPSQDRDGKGMDFIVSAIESAVL